VFIPGQYRVNPYSVKSGKVLQSHNGRGAWYKYVPGEFYDDIESTFIIGQTLFPGIHTLADLKIATDDPVYFITQGFPNGYTIRPVYGYEPDGIYYQVAYVVGDWWRYRLAYQGAGEVTPHEAEDYEQLALQKAYAKLGSADLELGESIGEYRETIQMLRSPLSALKKFLVDDKSRNWRLLKALASKDKRQVNRLLGRTGLATADTMSGTWLELRYGLRPLISLIQDVIDRVNSKQKEVLDPEKIRSARSRLEFPVENWEWAQDNLSTNVFIRGRVKVEDTYWASAAVQYTQSEPTSLLDSLGLTPRFLPEVAWELTRLSFVVDWIFSIGPWLGTLRINPGIDVLGNTTGFKHRRRVYLMATEMKLSTPIVGGSIPWTPLAEVHDEQTGEDLMFESTCYDRKVDTALSYLPHFTWGRTLDLFKAIDSISLIWQFAQQLRR
jgi:hypothetical protein